MTAASPDARVPPLRALLGDLEPADERTEHSVAFILDALERLPQPFDQDADPVHLTASAIVLGPRGVLLHRHKRLGRWLQPGGHVDGGEQPHDAAVRETLEETGVAAAHPASGPLLVHVDVHEVRYGHTHLDLRYLLLGGDVDPAPQDGESPDAAWLPREQAEAIADAGLIGALIAVRGQFSSS